MKFLRLTLGLFLFISLGILYAQGPLLRVAVTNFTPPFVMSAANNQLYGFDIAMMEQICHNIQRTCQFKKMPFKNMLLAVQTEDFDVAVSAITITAERSSQISFSLPYLVSTARFLGLNKLANTPISLELLNEKNIGIIEGTIFVNALQSIGMRNPKIKLYHDETDLMEALQNEEIDLALLDNLTAIYWEAQSASAFHTVGDPFSYGFGLGIAINPKKPELIPLINRGLLQYQESSDFKKDYEKYLAHF